MKSRAEALAEWEERRRYFEALVEEWERRLADAEERETRRQARLRRLTFGLLGRS